jgi:LuxR family transcriptional regulator of csgAB operon
VGDTLTVNQKTKEQNFVYIVGSKGLNNELLSYFLQQSTDPDLNCSLHDSFATLPVKKTKDIKNLVLCNCHDEHECDQTNACSRHIASAPADSYWACVNVPHNEKIAGNAINNGVRGIFYEDDSLDALKRGITAILSGELWFSREIISTSLSSFVDKNNIHASQMAADKIGLTKREKEILKLIALGKNNENIADYLNISTLTVKTHVSNIYRKINVPNRIQAIFWATKNFIHLKD